MYYTTRPLGSEGKVAFLFPGEGSQYLGMLSELALQFPEARAAYDEMDALRQDDSSGPVASDYLLPPANSSEAELDGANGFLWSMDGAVFEADNQQMKHSACASLARRGAKRRGGTQQWRIRRAKDGRRVQSRRAGRVPEPGLDSG